MKNLEPSLSSSANLDESFNNASGIPTPIQQHMHIEQEEAAINNLIKDSVIKSDAAKNEITKVDDAKSQVDSLLENNRVESKKINTMLYWTFGGVGLIGLGIAAYFIFRNK